MGTVCLLLARVDAFHCLHKIASFVTDFVVYLVSVFLKLKIDVYKSPLVVPRLESRRNFFGSFVITGSP